MGSSWRWGCSEDIGESGIPLIGGRVTVIVGPHAPIRRNSIVCHARKVLYLPTDGPYTLLQRLNGVRVLLSTIVGQHRWGGLRVRQSLKWTIDETNPGRMTVLVHG